MDTYTGEGAGETGSSKGSGFGDGWRGMDGDGAMAGWLNGPADNAARNGNGWGCGDPGVPNGGSEEYDCDGDTTIRSDPNPDDLRQLITNLVAFKHLFK